MWEPVEEGRSGAPYLVLDARYLVPFAQCPTEGVGVRYRVLHGPVAGSPAGGKAHSGPLPPSHPAASYCC